MAKEFILQLPADVPSKLEKDYILNYAALTRDSGNLMMFACDQKIEHLNQDFYGENIHTDAMHPEHIFSIASQGTIGALATHLGLISRYARQYPSLNYIAKLNGKTNIIPGSAQDPYSGQLWQLKDVLTMKSQTGLNIRGVGYTIYLGSEHEALMLSQAAEIVFHAHQAGLVTVLWIYPRGKHVTNDTDAQLLAGAAGVAASLGSDFVKIKSPDNPELMRVISSAAGNTKVIYSGGPAQEPEKFLHKLHEQINTGGAGGSATGRNIFQHALPQAVALTKAITAIVCEGKNSEQAHDIFLNAQK